MQNLTKTQMVSVVTVIAAILMLSGCGGGGGGSSSVNEGEDTSIVSRGMITGFGSVYVNGRRFHTDGASIFVDDDSSIEAELRIGMVVTVRGSVDDNNTSRAYQVVYDNELKGPVSSITPIDPTRKTAIILGQSVLITTDTTFDNDGGLTFASIAPGDVLEVSGFLTGTGLVATHVELQSNALEIEIKGHIDNLTATGFTVRGFPVSYGSSTQLEDIAALTDGLYVEVEGQLDGAGTLLIARKIEAESDDIDDDMDETEIQGMISAYDPGNDTFMIQGQQADASGAVFFPNSLVLADDLIVEVEGHIVNGVLFAEKVKQRGKKIKIDAPLSAVGGASVTFTFNGANVVVQVTSQTELEDDTGNPVSRISDFSAGNFVELEAFEDGSGVINANEIEREFPDEIEIEAPVDSFNAANRTVELFGILFDLSAASFEDENDVNISATAFFNSLSVGEFIEIRDTDSNGVFDKAELDD